MDDQLAQESYRKDLVTPEEAKAVCDFALKYSEIGYRRLTWMMIDQDVAYLSESSVYRILNKNDLLYRWKRPSRSKADKPAPASKPNERWHTDLMYLRIGDVWYFLISFIDAYSRYCTYWDLLPSMTAEEVCAAQEAAFKLFPNDKPDIVSDRGSQYTSKEYKELMREFELNHILCRVRHPQSNGVIERWHRTAREELEPTILKDYEQAMKVIAKWVEDYNDSRLHSAIDYMEPKEYFTGNPKKRKEERTLKLEKAKNDRINYWLNVA